MTENQKPQPAQQDQSGNQKNNETQNSQAFQKKEGVPNENSTPKTDDKNKPASPELTKEQETRKQTPEFNNPVADKTENKK